MTNKEISNIIEDKNNINKTEDKDKKSTNIIKLMIITFLCSSILLNFGAYIGARSC